MGTWGYAAASGRFHRSAPRSPIFTLHRVGARLRRVRSPIDVRPPTNFPAPGSPFYSASGRVGTACQPSCLSRATLAGRGKAPPCPPNQTRARQSHAPTLDASRIARSAIPTSNNGTPRSGYTTPCPHVTMSTCPLAAFSRAHLCTFAQATGRFAPLHCLHSPPSSVIRTPNSVL